MYQQPWDVKGPFISITYRRALQRKLEACKTLEDLKKIVFNASKTDEAIYRAFNEKLEEIQSQNPC